MISFKTYLTEACSGNYVCIEAQDLSSFFEDNGLSTPTTGTPPPDYHCTLIYSTTSHVEPERVMSALRSSGFDRPYVGKISGFECFDSVPKDGSRDASKSCIVAKLDCMALYQINDMLKGMGMRHSYAEFSPHITLRYDMSVEEAHKYRELLAGKTGDVMLNKFRSETINTNYV